MNDKILDILLKYNSTSGRCIYAGNYENVAKEISIEIKLLTSELEAKVYAYEKIIANSNFKTILEEKENKKKKDNKGE